MRGLQRLLNFALALQFAAAAREGGQGGDIPPGSPRFFLFLLYAAVVCCFAGLMSGLTVGYTSIDLRDLAIKRANGSAVEVRCAQRIQPILDNKHLLLATLLTANALAMESLPLFLDAIMPVWLAVIVSTTVVLVFGEVLPQAFCVGPHKLRIAAAAAPFVRVLIALFYPVCYPISRALDFFLGHNAESLRLAKRDLKALIDLHSRPATQEARTAGAGECTLTPEEIRIIHTTIDLRSIPVERVMTPLAQIFSLGPNDVLNKELLARIAQRGFSKVPVFGPSNSCLGVLSVKRLLSLDDVLGKTVAEAALPLAQAMSVVSNTSVLEAQCIMQQKKTTVLFISPKTHSLRESVMLRSQAELLIDKGTKGVIGMLTLNDVFAEILQCEFEDLESPGFAASAAIDSKKAPLLGH